MFIFWNFCSKIHASFLQLPPQLHFKSCYASWLWLFVLRTELESNVYTLSSLIWVRKFEEENVTQTQNKVFKAFLKTTLMKIFMIIFFLFWNTSRYTTKKIIILGYTFFYFIKNYAITVVITIQIDILNFCYRCYKSVVARLG